MRIKEDQRIFDLKSVHQLAELNHRSCFLKRRTNGKQLHDEEYEKQLKTDIQLLFTVTYVAIEIHILLFCPQILLLPI